MSHTSLPNSSETAIFKKKDLKARQRPNMKESENWQCKQRLFHLTVSSCRYLLSKVCARCIDNPPPPKKKKKARYRLVLSSSVGETLSKFFLEAAFIRDPFLWWPFVIIGQGGKSQEQPAHEYQPLSSHLGAGHMCGHFCGLPAQETNRMAASTKSGETGVAMWGGGRAKLGNSQTRDLPELIQGNLRLPPVVHCPGTASEKSC